MSKGKKNQTGRDHFSPENWARWNNSKRLKWMRNFRDKLRENDDALARKFELEPYELDKLDADIKAMEKVVISETAKNN
jgi:hypothetical protein